MGKSSKIKKKGEIHMKFAKRLKKSIESAGITQTEIANIMGIPQQTVSNWCNGISYPRLDRFYRLCKVINESADYLLGLD